VIALFWNIAEFITLRINKKGIHPGAHIALDFLIFGVLIASIGVDLIGYSGLFGLPGFPFGVGAVEGLVGYVWISWTLHFQLEL
jgi:hypothetical protein